MHVNHEPGHVFRRGRIGLVNKVAQLEMVGGDGDEIENRLAFGRDADASDTLHVRLA